MGTVNLCINREKVNKIKYYSAKLSHELNIDQSELANFLKDRGVLTEGDYKRVEKIKSTT